MEMNLIIKLQCILNIGLICDMSVLRMAHADRRVSIYLISLGHLHQRESRSPTTAFITNTLVQFYNKCENIDILVNICYL